MMTNGGMLIPSIIDFGKEAKYRIKVVDPINSDNIWSQYYDSLECYLQSTEPEDADFADCFVIIEANSREELATVLTKNCEYDSLARGIENLDILENECFTELQPCNSSWVGSDWDIQTRASGKYLMGTALSLEDLIPLNETAVKILMKVARFHFEDSDDRYIKIKENCSQL